LRAGCVTAGLGYASVLSHGKETMREVPAGLSLVIRNCVMTRLPRITTLLDTLEEICRTRGGRMTRQRRAVLAKLLVEKRPLSAYELLDRLRPEDASATPASVYRCLEFLLEYGMVHRLETTRSFVACEHPDHPHAVQFLICRECGNVVEAEDKRIAAATDSLGHRLGFAVDQKTVELTGICSACTNESAEG
jgi:Fur family transcriptional regulator, zinc uptake regulator